MTIDIDKLRLHRFEQKISWVPRDVAIYAMGVGAVQDMSAESQVRLARLPNPTPLPTFAACLARNAAPTVGDMGGDYSQSVLAAQSLDISGSLPDSGDGYARSRVVSVSDRGPNRGAMFELETKLFLSSTSAPFATSTAWLLGRADGGCGSFGTFAEWQASSSNGPPDERIAISTNSDQALLYSLSGDTNPLHIENEAALARGFERPILHGLCSWAVAACALIRKYTADEPNCLKVHRARFAAPIYPGEKLRLNIWERTPGIAFEMHATDRKTRVIADGWSEIEKTGADRPA